MSIQVTDGRFYTRNIHLASYLELVGYHAEIQREEEAFGIAVQEPSQRCIFWHKADDQLEEVVDDFYKKIPRVEPVRYALTMRNLKQRMYDYIAV